MTSVFKPKETTGTKTNYRCIYYPSYVLKGALINQEHVLSPNGHGRALVGLVGYNSKATHEMNYGGMFHLRYLGFDRSVVTWGLHTGNEVNKRAK